LKKGRIAAARGRFNRIRQVAPLYTYFGIRTMAVLYIAESL